MVDFNKHLNRKRRKRVTMDFETRSQCNLKTAGAYKYSLDPTTQPTCLGFKVLGEPKVYFLDFYMINKPWKQLPSKLRDLWTRLILEGYEFSGHNAFFETCIYKNILVKRYGWPDIPFRQFRCTAAKAASCALPRNLEGAGSSLRLSVQKDKRGYVAMMATCKPQRAYNDWHKMSKAIAERTAAGKTLTPKQQKWMYRRTPEPPIFIEPYTHPEVFDVLYTYCKYDVRSEEELDETLPDLIPFEQEIWFLNQKLNWRGLRIDIPTVKKIVDIMGRESKVKLKELDTLTMGLVTKPGARKSIFEFLALDGIEMPDLKAQTVNDFLKNGKVSGDMKRLLEIRQALSKTSTKKYQGFIDRAGKDDRVRDILLYHGASTGRDTGTGIQPHNFPRGLIKVTKERPYAAVENVVECDEEMLRLLYGENLSILFSSILRNMIVPSEGKELFVADFSKIEVAVLWWLAGNEAGLEVLRSGKDPYIYQAMANTGKPYEAITEDERQLGKAQILGGGFGMGWEKFQKTAWDQYRLKLTDEQSKAAIKSYRETNEAVPVLWKDYERAAIMAVEDQKTVEIGRCKFSYRVNPHRRTQFLWVELPSGRRLAYADPEINWRVKTYNVEEEYVVNGKTLTRKVERQGQPQKTLEFWGVNPKTKKWAVERTWGGTLTENIVQATARDLMMPAMVRLEEANYLALLMVHDEGICEKPIGEGSIDEFVKILCEPPAWADGLPLEAKGWKGPRYRK